MKKDILARMKRATELTRAGRLADATTLIQGALAGATPRATTTAAAAEATPVDEVIEGEYVEIDAARDTPNSAALAASAEHTKPHAGEVKQFLRKWRRDAPVAQPPTGSADPRAAGAFVSGQHANAAGGRAYKLYVPSSYVDGHSLPLIVMLHGCTQGPNDFAVGTQMNAVAEEQRCFVLYPEQSATANHSRCWNWFRSEDQVRDRGEPAILAGMTREIVERYGIDTRRVYIAGLSAGGAMAAVMAVAYPELFAAVGIHSGLACCSAHDLPSALAAMRGMPTTAPGAAPFHATPTIVFHGDRDKTVHPRNGTDVIARSTHHEGGPGGQVSSERGQAPGGHAYTRAVHRDAAGRVLLEHWLVHGGGHAWFGGSRAGSYTDPRGPNASVEMVRFFLSGRGEADH